MDRRPPEALRDRAILIVRLATAAAAAAALGLTWLFANAAEAYFSGHAPAPQTPPRVPVEATPQQSARPVVTTVVHHSGYPPGTAPRPPRAAPGGAPAPPPPPVCHSTPSKPC
jgi:hypothetical protein